MNSSYSKLNPKYNHILHNFNLDLQSNKCWEELSIILKNNYKLTRDTPSEINERSINPILNKKNERFINPQF